jgi:transposase InsO family protein
MTNLRTALGFGESDKALFRFHILTLLYHSGWKEVNTAFPNLSRPTVYRWKKAYEDSGKKLNSLVPHSTKPKVVRRMLTPVGVLTLVKALREQYPRMGKEKIKLFSDEFCQKEELRPVAVSTIGKIIKRNNYFFYGKGGKRRHGAWDKSKLRVKICPSLKDITPGYLQLDGIKYCCLGKYYYFLTAVEIVTRQAFVSLVPGFSSKQAATFLKDILSKVKTQVHTIQTDNGSEFELYFEEATEQLGLTHLWSYPHSPKANGFVERFNWTVKDEFLYQYEDDLDNKQDFQKKLDDWVVYYNQVRPHQSLGYRTPYQYCLETADCLKSG